MVFQCPGERVNGGSREHVESQPPVCDFHVSLQYRGNETEKHVK